MHYTHFKKTRQALAHKLYDDEDEQRVCQGFWCAFCGFWHPWSEVAAFDLPRRFCPSCVAILDAIAMGGAW